MDRTRSPDLANDAIPTKTSIASQYERCIYTFSQLYERLESTDYDHDILSRIEDEIGRFRVWAAQVGVRRSGSASLNYRLREAPHVHSRVSELIDEIQEDLENGLNIVDDLSYSGPEWEISLGVDPETGSDNGTKSSELESLLKDIRHITTSLYKISTAIRNPVPRERLAKFAAIDVSHFKLSDIADIRQKFPEAPEYLVKRLGEANCKRRQLLQFYKIHHHNSAQYNDLPLPSDEGNASHRPKASRQFDIVIGDRGNTTTCFKSDATKLTPLQSQPATTIKPDTVVLDELGPDDDLLSEIFYAVSTNEHIRIQASPASHTEAAFNGESFQCPYCYQITKVENLHSWKIHVCRDLQPYVCTQVGCQDHEKLYDSQYSWYAHEVQAHRSEWYCNACSRPFDKEPFKTHLRNVHGMNCDEEITVMVEQCIREKETPEACVMCGVHLCVADIRKHLGRHLLDAAMLLLPYLVPDEDPRSKIEGIEASTDNVKPQTPNSLIYPVLELKSNPGRGSDSKNFHDSFSSKLLMSTLGGISAGDYSETHHEAEDCVAPRPVQPGKPNLSKNSRVLMGLTTATPAAQRIEMPVAFEDVNNTHALPQTITGATVQLLVGLDHAESSSDPFARLAELYPYSPIAVEGEGIIEGNEVTVGPARLADKETCSSKFEAVPGHPLITIECTGLRDDSGRGVGLGKVTGVWREAGSGESRHDEMVAYMAREREDAKGTLNAEGDMNKWVAKRERKVFMEGKGISSGSSLRTTATNLAEQAQCWSTLAGQAPHSQPNSVVGTRPTFTEQAFHSRPRLDYQVSQSVQKPFHSEDVDEDYYDPYISRYMTEFDSWTAAGPVSTSTVENIDSTNNLPTELYRYRYSDTSLIHAPRPQKAPFQRTTAITLGHGNNQKPDEMKSPWREIQPHRDSPQPPPIRYSRPSPMQYLDRGRRVPSPPSTLKSSSIASGTTGGTFPSVSGSEYGSFRWKPDASQLPNPSYQLSMQTMQPSRSGYGVYASEACEQVPAMVAARLALAEQAFPSGPNSMAGTRPALAKQASYSRPKLDYQVLQSVQNPIHSEDVDQGYDPYMSGYTAPFDSLTAAGPVSTSTVENIDSINNLPTELYPYRYSDASLIHAPRPQKAPFQRTTAITLEHSNNQKSDEMQSPWREIQPHRDSPQPPPIRYSRPSQMQYLNLNQSRRVSSPPSIVTSSSIASGTTGGTFPSVSGSEYESSRWISDAPQPSNPSYQLSIQTTQPSRSSYGVYASEAYEQIPAMVTTRPTLAEQASHSRPRLDYQVLQSARKPFHSEDVDEDFYNPYISRYMTELDSWTAAGPVSTSTVENIDSTNNLPTELYPYRYSDASLTRTPLGQKAPFQRTTATILGHGNNQPDEIQSPWREIDPHRDSPQPPRIRYSQPSPMQHLIRRKRVPSPPSTLKSSSIASGTTDGTSSSVSGSEYGGYVPHGPYTTVRTAEVLYCPISGCNRGPGNIRPFPRREDLLAHLRGVHRAGISSKTNLRSWLIDQGYNPHFL